MYPVHSTLLPYQSPQSIGKVLRILLVANIVFIFISMIGEFMAIGVYSEMTNAIPTEEEELMAEGVTGIGGQPFFTCLFRYSRRFLHVDT